MVYYTYFHITFGMTLRTTIYIAKKNNKLLFDFKQILRKWPISWAYFNISLYFYDVWQHFVSVPINTLNWNLFLKFHTVVRKHPVYRMWNLQLNIASSQNQCFQKHSTLQNLLWPSISEWSILYTKYDIACVAWLGMTHFLVNIISNTSFT